MTGWALKRFWREATVGEDPAGYTVLLDGRPLRTPAKAPFVCPTHALAGAVADEWDAQRDEVRPQDMPFTRLANSAIDTVARHFDEVAETVAAYGGTDLLCYRATSPDELVARQSAAWTPLVDWTASRFGARLAVTAGVVPVEQDPAALDRLRAAVRAHDPFALAALHELVTLSGSLVLGLSVTSGNSGPEDAWDLSRIDEDWQSSLWGRDAEAEEHAGRKRDAFLMAYRFFDLARRQA